MKRWLLLVLLSGVAFAAQAESGRSGLNPSSGIRERVVKGLAPVGMSEDTFAPAPCSNPQGYSSDMDVPAFVPLYHQVPTVWLDWLSAGRPMDPEES
jgi:hypothetical protein